MEVCKFYDLLQPMECLAGDTLPCFEVSIDGTDDLNGFSMELLLAEERYPESVAFRKSCTEGTAEDDTPIFSVQLGSSETAGLSGTYILHFRLKDPDDNVFIKLAGTLRVLPIAGGIA